MASVKAIPGSVRYNGPHDGTGSCCRYLVFDEKSYELQEHAWPPPAQVDRYVDWYDFRGLGDGARVQELATMLGMPDMALEDALDITQRPKYEELTDSFLFTLDRLHLSEAGELTSQKVTLYWDKEFVLTLQEYPDDVFAHVTDRIVKGVGRIRKRGSAYLAYALIDNLIDDYTDALQVLEVMIENLETSILNGGNEVDTKRRIHRLKAIANRFRSTLGPVRDAVGRWHKSEHPGKEPKLKIYLQDLYDNTKRAYDLSNDYITRTNDLYQLFTSELSIRTNKVVQLLTVVSTIFIPLTFLTGLYGMNFDNIPELHTRYGYFVLWAVMIAVVAGLLGYFKRKGWF